MTFYKLSGAEIDVLYRLYKHAKAGEPLEYNDVPSKTGRNGLVDKGYATVAFSNPTENCDMVLNITQLGVAAYEDGIENEWR